MSKITPEQLKEIIESNGKWLRSEEGGKRANLSWSDLSGSNLSGSNLSWSDLSWSDLSGSDISGSNLSGSDLSGSDLRGSDLSGSNLRGSDLSGSDLSGSNLSGSDLSGSDISGSNLSGSDLRGSDLSGSNLRGSDLSGSDLSGSNLSGSDLGGSNLSDTKGLPDHTKQFDFLSKLERTNEGYICYKTFGEYRKPPGKWEIKEGSIIEEFTDMSMLQTCSHGINVATLDWVKRQMRGDIWKCLIKFEWLIGAVIPFDTDGKFRAARVQLIKNIGRV